MMIKKIGFFVGLFFCFQGFINYKIEQDYKQKKLFAALTLKNNQILEKRKTNKRLIAQVRKSGAAPRGQIMG